jgi:hypothetical protein
VKTTHTSQRAHEQEIQHTHSKETQQMLHTRSTHTLAAAHTSATARTLAAAAPTLDTAPTQGMQHASSRVPLGLNQLTLWQPPHTPTPPATLVHLHWLESFGPDSNRLGQTRIVWARLESFGPFGPDAAYFSDAANILSHSQAPSDCRCELGFAANLQVQVVETATAVTHSTMKWRAKCFCFLLP